MSIRNSNIDNLLWTVILIILFYQSVLHRINVLSNVALTIIFIRQILSMKKNNMAILTGTVLWTGILLGYSALHGNQVPNIVRFCLIILFIICAYSWKQNSTFFLKLLFYISSILVFAMICLEIFMLTLPNSDYLALRNGFFLANNMGDVYWYGIYYKLQLRGTPLLAFVYMLSYVLNLFPHKYKIFYRLYYLTGVLLAGNFAYQLAIAIFHICYYLYSSDTPQKMMRRITWMIFISLVVGGFVFSYVESEMETKADESNATRYDQAKVLLDDMYSSPITFLFGSGLGHTINAKTAFRDYRGETYFELQTLYFFNQLGLVNFAIFVLVNIILTFRLIKLPQLILIYGVYVMYAFTNPYMWDTNHIVVITSLLCAKNQIMNNLLNEERKSNLYLSSL